MIISVYHEVAKMKELPEDEFFEKLSEISGELFMPILEAYPGNAKSIVLYIIEGYSTESTRILLKSNWTTQKPLISDLVSLPDHLHGDVLLLQSATVKKVIAEYLDMQGDFDFKHLRMLQEMYERVVSKGFADMGEDFSIDDIKNMREVSSKLREDINDYMRTLIDKYAVYFDNKNELKVEARKPESLASVATSAHIKN